MELQLTALTLRPKPLATRGFFKLPLELRTQIYEYCLLDIPKWMKRHDPKCEHAVRDSVSLERPPFVTKEMICCDYTDCHCSRRQGVSLLRVNRQIHSEAAELFWTRNTFLFVAPTHFAVDVGENLRSQYRDMLRHVCIMGFTHDAQAHIHLLRSVFFDDDIKRMWNVLLQCRGLRTLELAHALVTQMDAHVARVPAAMPHLERFQLTLLLGYTLWPRVTKPPTAADIPRRAEIAMAPAYISNSFIKPVALNRVLWFKAGRALDPAAVASPLALKEAMRDFLTNFLVHVRYAVVRLPGEWVRTRRRALVRSRRRGRRRAGAATSAGSAANDDGGSDSDSDSDSESDDGSVSDASSSSSVTQFVYRADQNPAFLQRVGQFVPLRDGPLTLTLDLRDGSACSVDVMGLPISPRVRKCHAFERMQAARARRAAGEPEPELVAWRAAAAEKNRAWAKYLQEVHARYQVCAARWQETERRENMRERSKAQKQEKAAQRAAVAQTRQEAEAVRQAERKRFPGARRKKNGAQANEEDGERQNEEETAPQDHHDEKGTAEEPPRRWDEQEILKVHLGQSTRYMRASVKKAIQKQARGRRSREADR